MEHTALYIDPDTRDLELDGEGVLRVITGDAVTAQAMRLTLQVYKGEWPLDESHGTDYKRVMGMKQSQLSDEEIAEVVREAVYQEDEVAAINELAVDREGRSLGISVTAALQDGRPVTVEVNAG